MAYALFLALGAIGAGLWMALLSRLEYGDRLYLAVGLAIAAAVYVVLGVGSASALTLGVTTAAVGFFSLLGIGGARRWVALLTIGWGLHALWDLLAPYVFDLAYMPGWYAPACLGFDLVVASYLVTRPTDPISADELLAS